MKENRILSYKKEIIDINNPLSENKELNIKNYYLVEFEYEIPFVQYLLQATNNEEFNFQNINDLYNKNNIEEDIKEVYFNLYKINNNKIKIKKINQNVISFAYGKFYKKYSKEEFSKFLK